MRAQAAADGQTGPAEGACVVVQEGVNAAGGAGMHTLHCGAWGAGERREEESPQTDRWEGGIWEMQEKWRDTQVAGECGVGTVKNRTSAKGEKGSGRRGNTNEKQK